MLFFNKKKKEESNIIKGKSKTSSFEFKIPTVYERLRHASTIGFAPKTIYDIGANRGRWAKRIHIVYPESKYICVEPNNTLNGTIKDSLKDIDIDYEILNYGISNENTDDGVLNIWGDNTSAASLNGHIQGDPSRTVKTKICTLDKIYELTGLKPDLIKLDLQGGELNALEGATKCLETCEMIIAEFGCLDAYLDRTTPFDLFKIMYDNDYCLYDLVDYHYRPYDGALVGGDFFFVKNSSGLRSYKDYE